MTKPDVRQPDPGIWLLDRIDAREQILSCQIEQTETEIAALTTRLGELSEAIEHLRITRKTLVSLAEDDPAPVKPTRRPLFPLTPITSRFSPSSPRPVGPCAPATWPSRWICP